MLDTDLCVRVLRDRPEGLRSRFNAETDGLCMSSITFAELVYGAEKSAKPMENRTEVDRLAARVGVLAFDDRAAPIPLTSGRTSSGGVFLSAPTIF